MKNKTEDVLNKVYLWDRKIGTKDSGKGNMLKEQKCGRQKGNSWEQIYIENEHAVLLKGPSHMDHH